MAGGRALLVCVAAFTAGHGVARADPVYGSIRSPLNHLGEIRPRLDKLGTIRGPRAGASRLDNTGGETLSYTGGGFVMQVTKPAKNPDADSRQDGALNMPRDIPRRVASCWTPPVAASAAEVTVRLSFSRDGAVVAPRITYVKTGDPSQRQAVRDSILVALRVCAPLRFTAGLGQAIAGRSFAIRFIAPASTPGAST